MDIMKKVAVDIGVEEPTLEEVKDVMKELDKNCDGKLSMEEFRVLIE